MRVSRTVRGISLLELVAALAISGTIAALSVSSYIGFTTREKGLTALTQISMQTAKARQLAVTKNQPVRMTVRAVVVNGMNFNAVRWEALPCNDVWGTNCPTAACASNACGVGGCTCTTATSGDVGSDILAPPGSLTVPVALDGLCFLGGSGLPSLRSGGTDCLTVGAPITPTTLPFLLQNQRPAYLQLDQSTGLSKLLDCNTYPDGAACP